MRPRSSWFTINESNHLRRMMLRSLPVLLRRGQARWRRRWRFTAGPGYHVGQPVAGGLAVHVKSGAPFTQRRR